MPCRHESRGCEDVVMVRIGHRPHVTEGSPSISQRVGGEIETVGVASESTCPV